MEEVRNEEMREKGLDDAYGLTEEARMVVDSR